MANKPEGFPTWSPLSFVEITALQRKFYDYYAGVLKLLKLKESEIACDRDTLAEIITRVEKRRVYFWIYYSEDGKNCKMSKCNETALYCYWIVKLKPFYKADDPCINEKIATFHFVHRLDRHVATENAKPGGKAKTLNISERFLKVLSYDLRYRDISKEALMTFAEALIS